MTIILDIKFLNSMVHNIIKLVLLQKMSAMRKWNFCCNYIKITSWSWHYKLTKILLWYYLNNSPGTILSRIVISLKQVKLIWTGSIFIFLNEIYPKRYWFRVLLIELAAYLISEFLHQGPFYLQIWNHGAGLKIPVVIWIFRYHLGYIWGIDKYTFMHMHRC